MMQYQGRNSCEYFEAPFHLFLSSLLILLDAASLRLHPEEDARLRSAFSFFFTFLVLIYPLLSSCDLSTLSFYCFFSLYATLSSSPFSSKLAASRAQVAHSCFSVDRGINIPCYGISAPLIHLSNTSDF